MVTLPAEQFKTLNLMAGTARSLEQELLSDEDRKIWERDFEILCDDLSRIVDPELGRDLRDEFTFYDAACQVAKGYFDKIPFGGLKCATGQFGFRLLAAQDLKAAASATTPDIYSWVQSIATESNTTKVAKLISDSGTAYTCNAANQAEVLAAHRLISYKPSPRIIQVVVTVNDYPYAPYCVEPFSKVAKADKLFHIIPLPGRILLHPGGSLYIDVYVELNASGTPSGTSTLDFELALFGLVFGEYDYLKDASLT